MATTKDDEPMRLDDPALDALLLAACRERGIHSVAELQAEWKAVVVGPVDDCAEPVKITAAAIVIGEPNDAILLGTRPGSVAGRMGSANDEVTSADMPDPPGIGVWLWADAGSTISMPNSCDEDGGPNYRGSWIRPSAHQSVALVGGTMPWSDVQPEATPMEVERDELLALVERLRANLLDARCDLANEHYRLLDAQAAALPMSTERDPILPMKEDTP